MWLTGKRAFTIVELIVVIVVMAVFAGMIAPRLWGAGRASKLRASARRVFVTAQYARDFAATHRCDCRLVLDPAKGEYYLAYQPDPQRRPGEFRRLQGGPGKGEYLGEGVRFGLVRAESPFRGDEAPRGNHYITFHPSGQSAAAVVQITDGRQTYSILVFPSRGQSRLVEGPVTQLPNDRWDLDA